MIMPVIVLEIRWYAYEQGDEMYYYMLLNFNELRGRIILLL